MPGFYKFNDKINENQKYKNYESGEFKALMRKIKEKFPNAVVGQYDEDEEQSEENSE